MTKNTLSPYLPLRIHVPLGNINFCPKCVMKRKFSVNEVLTQKNIFVVQQLPYSLGLSPWDYYVLFLKIKVQLHDHYLEIVQYIRVKMNQLKVASDFQTLLHSFFLVSGFFKKTILKGTIYFFSHYFLNDWF